MAKTKFKEPELNEKDVPDTTRGKLKPGKNRESFKLASFWKDQVKTCEEFNSKWVARGNIVLKRFRDERSKLESMGARRMNLLWANIKIMKPAIYSKCPVPIVDRKYGDKDPIARLSSEILERGISSQLEHNFHSSVSRAVMDRLLPGRGVVWFRYEPVLGKESISIPAQSPTLLDDPLAKIAEETGDEDLLREDTKEEELEETGDTLIGEKVVTDYIDWKDFYIFPAKARTWEEVQAIGKRIYMSKHECKERFGEEIGEQMRPDTTPSGDSKTAANVTDTTIFHDINERSILTFEIWNKSDQRVYWVSSGYDYLCDVRDDPYKLTKFFPAPEPLSSTLTNDTLTPVPDYYEYQDQAVQIDELTQRISMLTKACKVVGVYNAAEKALARVLEETVDNQLIPLDGWMAFTEAGGLAACVSFLPIDQIQSCIKTLQEVRAQCMIDLDQITGISDVVRGTTDSRETLGGIRLKNNNAGTRLSESQEDVARFARDGINIMAELISKHFSEETLIECSGILYEDELDPDFIMREFLAKQDALPSSKGAPPQQGGQGGPPGAPPSFGGPPTGAPAAPPPALPMPPQNNVVPFPGQQPPNPMMQGMMGGIAPSMMDPQVLIIQKIEKAINLLRNDVIRDYRISIETDSTIFGDKFQDRQDATEFTQALAQFMGQFGTVAEKVPESMPLFAKTLEWLTRKYKVSRDLEAEVNTFCDRMNKRAKEMINNPPPDPETMKTQNEIKLKQMDAQLKAQNDQRDSDRQAQNDQRDSMRQEQEDMRKDQIEKNKADREERLASINASIKEREMQIELLKLDREAEYAKEEHEFKMKELKLKAEENEKTRTERAKQAKAKTTNVKKGN